jgi:predicted secreted hydrolase
VITRRVWLLTALLAADARAQPQVMPRALAFPRDHGSHDDFRIEWWYVTGGLRSVSAEYGFQVTFFRSRTDVPGSGRFAPRQLLFAHAAVSDVAHRKLLHAQRIARWNGDASAPLAAAASDDTRVHIGAWRLARNAGRYTARIDDRDAGFAFDLALMPSQPLLLQGDAGLSRKGPEPAQASHYVSEPQLRVHGELVRGGQREPVTGTAWLDHEWSETLMHPAAVGWDWIGMNLDDGGALMAFRLRRADGSTLWAGGTHRTRDGTTRIFGPDEVRFIPGRRWTSATTRASYPVEWQVDTPTARFTVRARFDAQELDSRASTGTVYWEGLSDLLDASGQRVGRGYLELTGYAQTLKL